MGFATWDLSYYAFLRLISGWPQSLFTRDVFFLIPVPWIGPVITPIVAFAAVFYLGVATRCHSSPRDYEVMNLSEWANIQGIHPQSAYRWFREGTLPVPARQIGRLILVGDLETSSPDAGITAVYARVSSGDQRADLDRQVARVSVWATSQGHSIDRVVTEVGS